MPAVSILELARVNQAKIGRSRFFLFLMESDIPPITIPVREEHGTHKGVFSIISGVASGRDGVKFQ